MVPDWSKATTIIASARSFLFVPGNRPDRFDKAIASQADVVILDLEDAVPPTEKAAARAAVSAWLDPARPAMIRINAIGSAEFEQDCVLLDHPACLGCLLPKAEPSALLQNLGLRVPVMALVESAVGVANMQAIAATAGVARLALGTIDLALDLDMTADDRSFDPLRVQMTIASRIGGIAAPVDGVCTELRDGDVIAASMTRARELGFSGKMCIHPAQVESVYRALMPTDQEMAWARRVLVEDAKANGAAVAVDGMMIDYPVVQRARRILSSAGVR